MEISNSTPKPNDVEQPSIIESEKTNLTKQTNVIKKKKHSKKIILISFISLILLTSFFIIITSLKKLFNDSNYNIDSNYQRISPHDSKYIYIPIAQTNDIHGRLFPKEHEIFDGKKTISYTNGGLEYLAKYISILKEEFGKERVLFFDSGDKFTNSINENDNILINEFLNLMGLDGGTLGNHEYDYDRKWIEKMIKKSNFKILVNNIKNSKTNKTNGILGNNFYNSYLYEMKLSNNDIIKIGVIGLTYNMKNEKTLSIRNAKSWNDINFYSYMTNLEKESKKLRKKGANAIILLCHLGLLCDDQKDLLKLNMFTKNTTQKKKCYNIPGSDLYKVLDKIKPGVVDAIVGGDTHYVMHHWENDIPVVSTNAYSSYLNILYLPFIKNSNGEYKLANDEIKIEGPIPVCEKIFVNYKNCEPIPSKEYTKAGKLIKYKWHNKFITKSDIIDKISDKYKNYYKSFKEDQITKFIGFDELLSIDNSGDCMLCNLLSDAIRDIKKVDFVILNPGAITEKVLPGKITLSDFFNMMPYGNKLCSINLSGEELIKILKIAQIGQCAYYSTSGLMEKILIRKNNTKEVVDIKMYDGSEIEKNKVYRVAGTDFILSETGGNDFEKPEILEIIRPKLKTNLFECSKELMYIEIGNYFRYKNEVDLRKYVNKKRPRIKVVNE